MQAPRDTQEAWRPERASEWLVALEEHPDDPDLRARFSRWHDADPRHARDWAEIERTARVLARLGPELRTPLNARTRRAPIRPRWHVAAVAMAACLLLLLAPAMLLRLQADHWTGTAELRSVRLADGSTVQLGPHSALSVEYGARSRTVRLLRGRGFFEVVADPAKPFQVLAGDARATVLGTGFEVRMVDGGVAVGVRHGQVRVDGPAMAPEVLGAGERVRVAGQGSTRDHRPAADIAAWTKGEIIAKNMPLADLVDEIRPYHPGIIILHGQAVAEAPLTGIYRPDDSDAALEALAAAHGARVLHPLPWVTVITR